MALKSANEHFDIQTPSLGAKLTREKGNDQ